MPHRRPDYCSKWAAHARGLSWPCVRASSLQERAPGKRQSRASSELRGAVNEMQRATDQRDSPSCGLTCANNPARRSSAPI